MQGNFTVWEENKRVQDDRERAENERLEKDIARLGEAARRTERWSGRAEPRKSTPATAACGRTGVFWATRRPS